MHFFELCERSPDRSPLVHPAAYTNGASPISASVVSGSRERAQAASTGLVPTYVSVRPAGLYPITVSKTASRLPMTIYCEHPNDQLN